MKAMGLILLFVVVLIITGIIMFTVVKDGLPKRVSGTRTIEGVAVVKINSDVVFGGTFTDWRDDIYFSDGTMVSSQGRDLSSIQLNRTGKFYFDMNYFEYDDCWYEFDNFIRVEYYDDF